MNIVTADQDSGLYQGVFISRAALALHAYTMLSHGAVSLGKGAGRWMIWAGWRVRVQRKGSSVIRSSHADGYIYSCWACST